MDSAPGTLRITHVITGIRPHGAELALLRLVRESRDRCDHRLIVLSAHDDLRDQFEGAGAAVEVIGIGRRRPNPFRLVRLARSIRAGRPHVVQTWLPAADLVGGVAARLVTRAPVVWNLRISEISRQRWGLATYLACRINGLLSRVVPCRIVAIGRHTATAHADLGFDRDRMTVIHNGFDIPSDVPDRFAARDRLGLPREGPVVSRLARFHPDKDFPTLLTAWSAVVGAVPAARLVMAGVGIDDHNDELVAACERTGAGASVVLLGELNDPTPLYAASDLTVSSSLAEGLPNVIGEAMTFGVPAVVTDVGDSAALVGSTGRVVPAGDAPSLAAALVELLTLPANARERLGRAARARMAEEFSMERMAARYVALWGEAARVRD